MNIEDEAKDVAVPEVEQLIEDLQEQESAALPEVRPRIPIRQYKDLVRELYHLGIGCWDKLELHRAYCYFFRAKV